MAGLGARMETIGGDPALSSRRFFATMTWLRWRMFVNAMRSKGATGELVVRFLSYPIVAIMVLGPSFGAGLAAWYCVNQNADAYLAIPLWVIFVLWQFIGVSTSASGPSFDLDSLTRFPIRYRDYLLMRLAFGLLDLPTVIGTGCLIAMIIGIGAAAPVLFPWAAITLLVYALCNILFSRMIYTWMERWLARRRTREMITGLILIISLCGQFTGQIVQRFSTSGHHAPPSPWMLKTVHIALAVNWVLPSGLTAFSIEHMHGGDVLLGLAGFAGLLIFTLAFLLTLHVRLHAQYLGENLSEAPAAASSKAMRKARPAAAARAEVKSAFALLPATVTGLLVKELRILLRSGPKLYALVMPIFIVFLFSFRTAGLDQAGIAHGRFNQYLFASGCAYMQLLFVGFIYNSLGTDGAGVQFYFIAPMRMREVILAKNLMMAIILVIEVAAVYITSTLLSARTPVALAATTLAWTAFTFLINTSIGNVRSLVAPKGYDPAKVRRQNVSGLSSFISLAVIFAAVALGQVALMLCRMFEVSYWAAAAVFAVLAAAAFGVYWTVLNKVDGVAASHVEELTRELGKF